MDNYKKETQKNKNRTPDHTSPDWNGYTLKELIYRKEINRVKQQIIIERLGITFTAIKENYMPHSTSGLISKFNSMASIANYGITGYRIFTQLRSLFRTLKK